MVDYHRQHYVAPEGTGIPAVHTTRLPHYLGAGRVSMAAVLPGVTVCCCLRALRLLPLLPSTTPRTRTLT